jgi:hypothetical protein
VSPEVEIAIAAAAEDNDTKEVAEDTVPLTDFNNRK